MAVTDWHIECLCGLGFRMVEQVKIETPSHRFGRNSEARMPYESVILFEATMTTILLFTIAAILAIGLVAVLSVLCEIRDALADARRGMQRIAIGWPINTRKTSGWSCGAIRLFGGKQ